jgi:hypothetical protein
VSISTVTQVGSVTVDSDARSLRVDGDEAYLVSGSSTDGGFSVLDVTDPASMSVLGSIALTSTLRDLRGVSQRSGDIVCCVGHNNGNGIVACIDVSNPAAPSIAGSFTSSNYFGEADCVRVGDTVFSAGNNLSAANVATPSSPTHTSSLAMPVDIGVAIDDLGSDLLAVIETGVPPYFRVADVSNPSSMSFIGVVSLGSLRTPRGTAKHPTADVAYVACAGSAGSGRGFAAVDVSTPTAPSVAHTETTASYELRDCVVTADGSSLLVGGTNVILVYDVSTPTSPTLVYTYLRDDQPSPNNKNTLDSQAFPTAMALKAGDGALVAVGDAGRVVGFVLAQLGGWQVGSVAF